MKQDHIEREQQFEAPDLNTVEAWIRSQPQHATIAIEPVSDKTQRDTYFDTPDAAVYRAGFTLRLRRLPEASELTLKMRNSSVEGPQERREINQKVTTATDDWLAAPGPVAERARLIAGRQRLAPLFEVETHRRNYGLARDGETLAVLSLDDTSIHTGDSAPFKLSRVEIEEEREGGLERVQVMVEALARACALQRADSSKFDAGLKAAGIVPGEATNLGNTELWAGAGTRQYAYAVLRRYFRDFLRHEPGTRLGDDPEELHDVRVATRRLRAAIKTFRPFLPPAFEGFRQELQWVGRCLGEVRDLDVQTAWLEDKREESDWEEGTALGPLLAELHARRDRARGELLEALDSDRYLALQRGLIATLRMGYAAGAEKAVPIRSFAAKLLKKDYRRFHRRAEALGPDTDLTEYHATRIEGKRLRYAIEALEPVLGRRGLDMVITMRATQDVLGEMQDCSVTVAWLREMATTHGAAWPPATLLRMGELIEQRRARIQALREQWPQTEEDVSSRWRKLRRSLRKPRLDEPVALESEPDPAPVVPVAIQGRFQFLRRFLRRGGDATHSPQ